MILAALCLAMAIPLLWPQILPLTDLPGHIGRYKIELTRSAEIARYYDFEWRWIGNLGVDLLVIPLARLVGLEPAVKLIVIAIPVLTAAGMLLVARVAHGQVPPTALFALPFAYGYPFIFGFANYALSMALALLAFALWLALGRRDRLVLRGGLFVPLSFLVWTVHAFGWGVLGLMAFAADWARYREEGRNAIAAAGRAAMQCMALALPLFLMVAWRTGAVENVTGGWLNIPVKLSWIAYALHDRWAVFDVACLAGLLLFIATARRSRRLEFLPAIAVPAVILAIAFLFLPRILFGSAYADMRLAPYAIALALLAIRPSVSADRSYLRWLTLFGFGFLAIRLAALTVSFWLYDREYERELAALAHIPEGARLVSLVGSGCALIESSRKSHLPSYALIRRNAYANDQWAMAGAQLVTTRIGPPFDGDPSQLVTAGPCARSDRTPIDLALARVADSDFDYLWLIDPPRFDERRTDGMELVWRDGTSALYRLAD